jgi:nucleotide-binding universal stress UspA family protein
MKVLGGTLMALRKQFGKGRQELIVPTNFSARSATPLAFARLLAKIAKIKDRATAVHAIDPLPYQFGPRGTSNARKEQVWIAAQHSMTQWLQQSKFSRGIEAMLIEGEPGPAIPEFAAAESADFLILATSARQQADRVLLRSAAEEIFRLSKCPVVVLGPKVRLPKTSTLSPLQLNQGLYRAPKLAP